MVINATFKLTNKVNIVRILIFSQEIEDLGTQFKVGVLCSMMYLDTSGCPEALLQRTGSSCRSRVQNIMLISISKSLNFRRGSILSSIYFKNSHLKFLDKQTDAKRIKLKSHHGSMEGH